VRQVEEQTILVTGATDGLGRALALDEVRRLAEHVLAAEERLDVDKAAPAPFEIT
jgi:NAD(P)-dependent dehydrogenase (short-subunit alcohol dehydrogenase family)